MDHRRPRSWWRRRPTTTTAAAPRTPATTTTSMMMMCWGRPRGAGRRRTRGAGDCARASRGRPSIASSTAPPAISPCPSRRRRPSTRTTSCCRSTRSTRWARRRRNRRARPPPTRSSTTATPRPSRSTSTAINKLLYGGGSIVHSLWPNCTCAVCTSSAPSGILLRTETQTSQRQHPMQTPPCREANHSSECRKSVPEQHGN
mmetsp:Transcript_25605/g.102076  ORF Transcript_25605/g.102076 Transcript_25605/m.102076 type:complete len:202 (-) Transcript_25605:839-1444(-)